MKAAFFSASLFLLLTFISNKSWGQFMDFSAQELAKSRIKKIEAHYDMADDNPKYEGLPAEILEFDRSGKLIRIKYIHPFFDVVSTSEEYIYKRNEEGKKLSIIHIHRTEALTSSDSSYIKALGPTLDSSFTINRYDSRGLLVESKEYKAGDKDTLISQFEYLDTLKIGCSHVNSSTKGKFHQQNYYEEFFYDSLCRLTLIEKTHSYKYLPTKTQFTYMGNARDWFLKKEEERIRWSYDKVAHTYDPSAHWGKLTQKTLGPDGQVLKKTYFRSLSDTSQNYYGYLYQYKDGKKVVEQSFNHSQQVRLLTDKNEFIYDKKGWLLEERRILRGKWAYSLTYTYETY